MFNCNSAALTQGDLTEYTYAEGLLAELPRFPHLQHLWLRVHVEVGRYGIAAEPCTTLATVLPQLPYLSGLELFAEFMFRFTDLIWDRPQLRVWCRRV